MRLADGGEQADGNGGVVGEWKVEGGVRARSEVCEVRRGGSGRGPGFVRSPLAWGERKKCLHLHILTNDVDGPSPLGEADQAKQPRQGGRAVKDADKRAWPGEAR